MSRRVVQKIDFCKYQMVLPSVLPEIAASYKVYEPALARGEHSLVYVAKEVKTGSFVAVKLFQQEWTIQNRLLVQQKIQDAQISSTLAVGPKVLKAIQCHNGQICIVMELCNAGSLDVCFPLPLPEELLHNLARYLVRALELLETKSLRCNYLTRKHILVHVEANGSLSFRLLGALERAATIRPGHDSKGLVAPEVKIQGQWGAGATVWSYGVLLYYLATARWPQDVDHNLLTTVLLCQHLHYPAKPDLHPRLRALILRCLQFVPELRPSLKQLLATPFLSQDWFDIRLETYLKSDFKSFLDLATGNSRVPMEVVSTLGSSLINLKPLSEGTGGSLFSACRAQDCTGADKLVFATDLAALSLAGAKKLAVELDVTQRLSHSPYFATLTNCFLVDRNLYIVKDLCNGGTLAEYVRDRIAPPGARPKERRFLSLLELRIISWHVVWGLRQIRLLNVPYVALHPKAIRIVMDEETNALAEVIIADIFGNASASSVEHQHYTAPELLARPAPISEVTDSEGEKALVWTFGAVLYFCLYGMSPGTQPPVQPSINPEHQKYLSLMQKCLCPDPGQRPTLLQVLQNDFFKMLIIPRRSKLDPYTSLNLTYATGKKEYYTCTKKGTKKQYDVLCFHEQGLTPKERSEMEHKAQSMMLLVGCKHVARLYDCFSNKGKIYFILEHFDQDLDAFLINRRTTRTPLTPLEQRTLAYQLILAISETHARNVIHRNVTPTNIMVREESKGGKHLRLKLSGFDLAKPISNTETDQSTILLEHHRYLAPEATNPALPITQMVDLFSYGLILFYILYGEEAPNVIGSTEVALLPTFPVDQELVGLMQRCLDQSPLARPTAAELVALPLFESLKLH